MCRGDVQAGLELWFVFTAEHLGVSVLLRDTECSVVFHLALGSLDPE